MSKTKTRNHQFYYEGMYWSSREEYATWVRARRIIAKAFVNAM